MNWWREQPSDAGVFLRLSRLAAIVWEFTRGSLPDRRRQRFGDAGYDWDHRVDTTSANVGWRARLIGLLNSEYQPIEPEIFTEMLNPLEIDHSQFTFVDIGSGKGRALLLASAYPFRRIIGVELLPELNRIAEKNIEDIRSERVRGAEIKTICQDAISFEFPDEPLVVYFFHPLPEAGFRAVVQNLCGSLARRSRPVYLVYANPIFEMIVAGSGAFRKISGTYQYALYVHEE